MKIAVTGNDGFLGKHLVGYLESRGYNLSLFDKKKNNLFSPKSLESFLKDADVVVHLAGANRDSDFNLLKNNSLGTLSLLDGIKKYSPKSKIIFASSFQIYTQNNMYSLSKRFAEELIELESNKSNLKSIILRISNIYGTGGKPNYNSVIATFLDKIRKGEEIVINGDGNQKRDYIYVGDVVTAIEKSIEYKQNKNCEYFDICYGKMVSLNKIVDILNRLFLEKVSVKYNNLHLEFDEELKKDNISARKFLKWSPGFDIDKGLKEIVKRK